MNPVARTDNLAQFIQLVSEARARNSASAKTGKAASALKPQFATHAVESGLTGYNASSKIQRTEGPSFTPKQSARRSLGARFDAYA
jgi:hypothetical protein